MSFRKQLAATGAAVVASAGAGIVATTPEADWYRRLDKPRWQPPGPAFGLVWTPLYADLALTSAQALATLDDEGRHDEAAGYRRALAANLVLNTGWSVLFWRVRRPWLATAWSGVLAASSLDLVRRLHHVDPRLHHALTPYPAWCAFATALNASIARRN